jgi:hypothetical protein
MSFNKLFLDSLRGPKKYNNDALIAKEDFISIMFSIKVDFDVMRAGQGTLKAEDFLGLE